LSKPLNETVNPDEVVAMGAAVQAGILAGEITDLILLDVTPLSLGVETMGGLMTPIITRNASIPVKQSENFSTGADFQDSVEIHILQGERQFAKDNKSLGVFKLNGIPSAPRGIPKINVTFQLDVNGLLSVSAREEDSGVEQSIKIEGASVLGRDEVTQMIQDAEKNAKLDKTKKSLVNITYEVDNFLSKSHNVLGSLETNCNAKNYFSLLEKKLKHSYLDNKFFSLTSNILKSLKNALQFLIFESLQNEISKIGRKSNSASNIIDVDLADE